jgi:hypothetical protein
MRLPTPDCPWCSRRVEDRGDHFECLHCSRPPLPPPVAWYLSLAGHFGRNASRAMPLSRYAYVEARWAARAAMRAVPELRSAAELVPVPHPSSTEPAWLAPDEDFLRHSTVPPGSDPEEPNPAAKGRVAR